MQIKNNNLSFGSRNYPIKPFKIQTKRGDLLVEELTEQDGWKAAKFAIDCTLNSIPPYTYGSNIDPISKLINTALFKLSDKLTLGKKDGNSTIIVAKDSKGKIKAFISMSSIGKIRKCPKEACAKIGYGNDILVDRDYRNMGVGQVLSDKIMQAAKGHFTDIIIPANYGAINFHQRNGFEELDLSNPKIQKIIQYLPEIGNENFIFMSKSLTPQAPWWERLSIYFK